MVFVAILPYSQYIYAEGMLSVKEPQYISNLKCVTEDPLTLEEMEKIGNADKNCRLIKGQVFLWPGASGWEDLWGFGRYYKFVTAIYRTIDFAYPN